MAARKPLALVSGNMRQMPSGDVEQCARANLVVDLSFATPLNTDASLGNTFRVTVTNSFTLANPSNPTHGQMVIWRIKQDGTGSRIITLDTKFRLGTDISSVVLTTAINKIDYLGAKYDLDDDKWDVVSFVKGY